MANKKLPQSLIDSPLTQLKNWLGFSAKKDKTMLPPTILVEPSQNCFVPDSDKVVPRHGSQLAFQGSTALINTGVIGRYRKFKNFAGIEMDVKAFRDTVTTPTPTGEQVFVRFNGVYVPITIAVNTALNGDGKIYFSTYTDTNLDLSQNKRIPRLLWVNGHEDPSNGTGRVFSWTGGISAIDTIVANVITIPVGQTWRKLGFTEYFDAGALTGEIHVTINGVDYFSNNLTELDTNTLTLNANPTAVAGDTVTSTIEVDDLIAPMDHVKQNKNYAYYGNFDFRQWFMSNQFGRPENVIQTGSNAELDDMNVVSLPSAYTGNNLNKYRVQIVTIDPAINEQSQSFFGGGLDDGTWNTSAYSATGENTYKIVIVANASFTFTGTPSTIPTPGETLTGNTSGAQAYVVSLDSGGEDPVLNMLPGSPAFQVGETVTGTISGLIPETIASFSYADWFKVYKNGVRINAGAPYSGTFSPSQIFTASTSFVVADGITFIFETFTGHTIGSYWQLVIEVHAGSADRFGISKNGGTITGSYAITGASQSPAELDGIAIQFGETEGHKVGDYWDISANRGVFRPWADFYYTLDFNTQQSVRRPGEGYIYDLPSNFWTSDTFEDSIYANTSNGEWGYTNPTLSADLLSEDISFIPLKQVVASKVLYPYLTGHNRNDMIFIDENKNLVSMGRLQLIQKVQMLPMSYVVQDAFKANSWVDGDIVFQDDKTWITSPHDGNMLCYDERTKYWQPPQVIPNLGLLTIIETELYAHSYLDTGTRRLNDPTAVGDDGSEYTVIVRSGTYDHGDRWNKKTSNMGFWEGRVFEEMPVGTMKMKAYFDPDGCSGIEETNIIPKFCCEETNQGNFGGGNDGDHEFGGDVTEGCDYARFQWDKLKVHHFYFSSLEFICRTTVHPYEILSMGINLAQSKFNNKDGRPDSDLDDLLPLN